MPGSTAVDGNNNSGTVTGYYYDSNGAHGFTENGGIFQYLNAPAASPGTAVAVGINNDGTVTGFYYDNSSGYFGFVKTSRGFTGIDEPNALTGGTVGLGVNNVGAMTGHYTDATGDHGFVASPVATPNPPRSHCAVLRFSQSQSFAGAGVGPGYASGIFSLPLT